MNVIKGNKPILPMYVAIALTVSLVISCGTPARDTPKTVIGPKPDPTTTIPNTEPTITTPKIPKGAVTANFLSDKVPFYAVVSKIDRRKGITTIRFQERSAPDIIIPETYGAKLSTLRFKEFDRDLLLVTTTLKDPVFNKYYLYIFKNNAWHLVVSPFSIHKDNHTPALKPIVVDAANTNNMKRYYSVFDLDETSTAGYTWRLLQESVPILKR